MPARTKDKRRRRLSFVSSVICLADSVLVARASGSMLQAGEGEGSRARFGGKDAGDMGLHG